MIIPDASYCGVLLPWPLPEVAPFTLLPKSEPLVVAAVFSEALEAWLPGTLTKAEFAFCYLYLLLLFVLGYWSPLSLNSDASIIIDYAYSFPSIG